MFNFVLRSLTDYVGELIFARRIRLVINIFDNLTETITSRKAAQALATKGETRCGKIAWRV